ncbi:unnamed protein product [Linum tenue]|uniref:Uncharacterized protein n=1 Tax=Linum tenue TaxID=586396 RepID=A0AAV0LJ88_9ROSI|nr:unnamed protein product [Linum tenue]
MARARQPLLLRPPFLHRRSHGPIEAQPGLFPRQLRHGRPLHPLRQPPVAPFLHDRLPNRPRRLAVPLLLSRRAPGDPPPHRRRPRRAGPARRRHRRRLGFYGRVAERVGVCVGRGRDCPVARRV